VKRVHHLNRGLERPPHVPITNLHSVMAHGKLISGSLKDPIHRRTLWFR
jgi:hypothetical protein